jgi:hypothetical protein
MDEKTKSIEKELNDFVLSNNNSEFKNKYLTYHYFICERINEVSKPYKEVLNKLSDISISVKEKEIADCVHDFERFTEYHNDRYFVCRKCGFEKY